MISLKEVPDRSVDIISMFHVVGHLRIWLTQRFRLKRVLPLAVLGCVLLIEVSHAKDSLFTLYNCDALSTPLSGMYILYFMQEKALRPCKALQDIRQCKYLVFTVIHGQIFLAGFQRALRRTSDQEDAKLIRLSCLPQPDFICN